MLNRNLTQFALRANLLIFIAGDDCLLGNASGFCAYFILPVIVGVCFEDYNTANFQVSFKDNVKYYKENLGFLIMEI